MKNRKRDIWVISDTHFNHKNILNFTDKNGKSIRPFSSVKDMNQTMIDNWNSVVKPGDIVYHLGDVLFGMDKENWLNENMPRLNGKKRLVFGNHDNPAFFVGKGHFSKTMLWRQWTDYNILMTHVPVHPSTLEEKHRWENDHPILNVHGHIHQNKSPKGPYFNACVEVNGYKPINIEDLIAVAKKM